MREIKVRNGGVEVVVAMVEATELAATDSPLTLVGPTPACRALS